MVEVSEEPEIIVLEGVSVSAVAAGRPPGLSLRLANPPRLNCLQIAGSHLPS